MTLDTLDAPPTTRRFTWHGVRTVAVLELRQRVRSTRWIVALVVWFVVVGGITLLASGALTAIADQGASSNGPLLFAVVSFLVLGLGLLVTPTLASTAINGDRSAGTLATLQVTLLSPSEIATGKLLAAWLAACAFLVASLPFLVLALAMGGTPVMSLVRVVLIIAVLLAAVCGIGLGYSALGARAAGSTVLTFLTVAGLTLLTPILFATTYPSISHEESVTVYTNAQSSPGDDSCTYVTQTRSVDHTERTWWLLGINPFVILADGAEAAPTRTAEIRDPLSAIRQGVRTLRAGPASPIDECWLVGQPPADVQDNISTTPFWYWGLGANVLLGAAGFTIAVRRLRIPQRKLPRGTRVA
ncbi:ABC transporter permease [Cellulomonas sp. McL0617]|uniref:ABC transporter permease n=1 Tax=Cellulomonas sp. McL0617 TaxID=3415675 RepID=UPI003CE8019F